jgi:hypothetical protein
MTTLNLLDKIYGNPLISMSEEQESNRVVLLRLEKELPIVFSH